MRRPFAFSLLLLPGLVAAQSIQYDGTAYAIDSDAVLYRESHFFSTTADTPAERIVLYRCPDGAPFARKHVVYSGPREAPSFELVDTRLGYREGVREAAGAREVFVQEESEAKEKRGPLPATKGLVADAGFDEFVQQHWDALQRGETVRFPFLVPSKLDYFNFKVSKNGEVEVDGQPASVIRLALSSWWAFLLPHIDVVYGNQDRVLLRFVGLTNVRDGDGDNFKARIEFPRASRKPLEVGAAAAALAVPLVAACAGG